MEKLVVTKHKGGRLSHDRRKPIRYNRGMLGKEKRAIGWVWTFRWSEVINGRRRNPKK